MAREGYLGELRAKAICQPFWSYSCILTTSIDVPVHIRWVPYWYLRFPQAAEGQNRGFEGTELWQEAYLRHRQGGMGL